MLLTDRFATFAAAWLNSQLTYLLFMPTGTPCSWHLEAPCSHPNEHTTSRASNLLNHSRSEQDITPHQKSYLLASTYVEQQQGISRPKDFIDNYPELFLTSTVGSSQANRSGCVVVWLPDSVAGRTRQLQDLVAMARAAVDARMARACPRADHTDGLRGGGDGQGMRRGHDDVDEAEEEQQQEQEEEQEPGRSPYESGRIDDSRGRGSRSRSGSPRKCPRRQSRGRRSGRRRHRRSRSRSRRRHRRSRSRSRERIKSLRQLEYPPPPPLPRCDDTMQRARGDRCRQPFRREAEEDEAAAGGGGITSSHTRSCSPRGDAPRPTKSWPAPHQQKPTVIAPPAAAATSAPLAAAAQRSPTPAEDVAALVSALHARMAGVEELLGASCYVPLESVGAVLSHIEPTLYVQYCSLVEGAVALDPRFESKMVAEPGSGKSTLLVRALRPSS